MIKTIYDVIKDIFKTVPFVGLEDLTFDELKEYVSQQSVFHTCTFENVDGFGIDSKEPNVETIHGICDDGEDNYSEVIFRKDGTAYIVNLDEIFIWNRQLFNATH